MSPDDTIILSLTRDNARLQSSLAFHQREQIAIGEILNTLKVPTRPEDDPMAFEGYSTVDRLHLLQQRIAAFPLDLTAAAHELPGRLFHVTIPTSIDDLEDYVVAPNKAAVERWLAATHPEGFTKGYEPRIKDIHPMLGDVHWISSP
jgi:hypothetical protein